MRVRLPLYAKILLWFFLNLAAVAAVFVVLFDVQFNFNLDWLLVTGARERIEAVRDLITGELDTTAPDEWPQVLQRYNQAHHVDFAVFDMNDAQPVVGDITELPPEVRARILTPPTFPGAPTPPKTTSGIERPAQRPFNPARWWPLRAIMRTTHPTQYWMLATGWLDNPMAGERMRIVLVARSSSISGGGLVFDPKPWLWLAFGVVVFTLFFWLPLIRGITRSVARMVQATRQIADGRLDVRVQVHRSDELGALGESINEMAARLDGLVVGQKRFLADIAHELCAPVARLQMALGILEQRMPPGEEQAVQAAAARAEQIAALVGELLSFSKAAFGAAAVPLQPVDLAEVVNEAVRREKTDGAEIRVDLLLDVRVSANPDLLVRAIANVLRNAIQHTTAGPITIHAAREGEAIVVTVSDSGPGVPEAELPKIFDAFYRVDASRSRDTGGAGLGLAIVKTCVESCGGTVAAHNREPHGLEVQLRLHASP